MTQFSGRNDLDVHNRLSRRSFIQIAGAATFGIAAASALGCAPTTEMAGTGESEAPAEEYDMVIVGAGGAGLSAAVTAAEQGKRVALLEKLPHDWRHLRAQPFGDHRPGRGDGRILRCRGIVRLLDGSDRGCLQRRAHAEGDEPDQRHPLVARGHGLQNVHDRQHSSRCPGAHCVQEPQRDGRARLRCRWNGIGASWSRGSRSSAVP